MRPEWEDEQQNGMMEMFASTSLPTFHAIVITPPALALPSSPTVLPEARYSSSAYLGSQDCFQEMPVLSGAQNMEALADPSSLPHRAIDLFASYALMSDDLGASEAGVWRN